MKDFSLNSGERQVGKTLDEIRFDHRVRYQLAIEFLKEKKHYVGLDCFCGNGYGSHFMANQLSDCNIIGIDASQEAIECANKYYSSKNILFSCKLFPFCLPKETFDFIVCFESLEHVIEGEEMMNQLIHSLKLGGYLFFSIPNENVHSLKLNKHPFHYKHYTDAEVKNMMQSKLKLIKMYGQNVYVFRNGIQAELLDSRDMILNENKEGQVNIYIYKKSRNLYFF